MSNQDKESYKEILHIIIAIVILTFIIQFYEYSKKGGFESLSAFYLTLLFNLGIAVAVILINIIGKKIVAYFYESKINHRIWTIERFGFRREAHFNKPIPAGIILPFILSLISYGYIMIMTILEFDVYSTTARTSKQHGMHRYTEMTEVHIGLIAAAGVILNLLASVIGYILGFPEFSRISIYYAAFSLIPLSNLDGAKIFFSTGSGGEIGSRRITLGLPALWVILVLITLIFLFFAWIPY